jgi:tetratricopeptide (TPR) repeat protein
LDKAIEIKRRAQRCVQNGDLDGALNEYRKLVSTEDSDPYNFVLLADLLYKKGDAEEAAQRYLEAARAYQSDALYKNAIAVCKKMLRLQLKSALVLDRLGELHGLDGLATEAQLYYTQHADLMMREDKYADATASLRKAFDACQDDVRVLDRLSQVYELQGETSAAAATLIEAAQHYEKRGQLDESRRCRARAKKLDPDVTEATVGATAPSRQAIEPGDGVPRASLDVLPGEALAGAESAAEGSAAEPAPAEAAAGDASAESDAGVEEPRLITPGSTPEAIERFPAAGAVGLRWEEAAAAAEPTAAAPDAGAGVETPEAAAPEPGAEASVSDAERIEALLAQAQEAFRRGDRSGAVDILLEAAGVYESLDRTEEAATIYRNLGKSARTPDRALRLWFANCERRGDRREAAEVASELGDRALGQGDEGEARAWFGQALALDESCEHARRRLQRLAALNQAPPQVEEAEGKVEISTARPDAASFDLAGLLNEFQRGLEQQMTGDAQAHYDLAMTYREMGLLEQAVDSFRKAAEDPAYAHRAAEMIGRCLLDQGRFPEAAKEFAGALQTAGLPRDAALGLRYQLGLALEAAGNLQEALDAFQAVFAEQSSYPDVALKIRVLKRALEQV